MQHTNGRSILWNDGLVEFVFLVIVPRTVNVRNIPFWRQQTHSVWIRHIDYLQYHLIIGNVPVQRVFHDIFYVIHVNVLIPSPDIFQARYVDEYTCRYHIGSPLEPMLGVSLSPQVLQVGHDNNVGIQIEKVLNILLLYNVMRKQAKVLSHCVSEHWHCLPKRKKSGQRTKRLLDLGGPLVQGCCADSINANGYGLSRLPMRHPRLLFQGELYCISSIGHNVNGQGTVERCIQ